MSRFSRSRAFLRNAVVGLATFCLVPDGPGSAQAHEVDTCLARLSQTAQLLKACQIAQSSADQCDKLKARLERNRQTCRAEAFPEESIEHAISYGRGEVEGAVERSPYRQNVEQRRREQSQMQPNLVRFSKLFPQYAHFRDAVSERFDSRLCPNAYEGSRDRWLYTGSMTLLQYSLSDVKSEPPVNREMHFFAQGKTGECYAVKADLEPGAPFQVLNLPDQMLSQLEQKAGVVRCESATCASDRAGMEELFQQYQTGYRNYRQLLNCVDLAQRSRAQAASKGGAPTQSLPPYCPTKELNVAMLNAKGLVQDLDLRLFGLRTRPLKVTKTE